MGWTGRRPWTLPVFGFSKAEAQVTERQWPEGEGSSASAGPPWPSSSGWPPLWPGRPPSFQAGRRQQHQPSEPSGESRRRGPRASVTEHA